MLVEIWGIVGTFRAGKKVFGRRVLDWEGDHLNWSQNSNFGKVRLSVGSLKWSSV